MSATEQQMRTNEPDPERELRASPRPRTLGRSFGLIAGILFIGGAFAGLPSSLLIDPAPPSSLYLITVAGVAFGLAAMAIPWDRISRAWAHGAMCLAIVEVGLTVALAGDPFVFYFVFIAIFAAYAFSDRSQVAIYLGLIAVALLVPILVIPDSTRASGAQALAAIPAIVLVAVMVAFLRERLEDNRRTTRLFAREALALSVRIGRLPVEPEPALEAVAGRVEPRHPRLRQAALGSSATLSVVALLGVLAAVGVALPGPIERSFATVGIEPSQGSDARADDPAPRKPQDGGAFAPSAQPAPRPASDSGDRRNGDGSATPNSSKELDAGSSDSSADPFAAPAPTGGSTPNASTPAGESPTDSGSSPSAPAPSGAAPSQPTAPPAVPPSPTKGLPPAPQLPGTGKDLGSALDDLLGQNKH